MTFPPRLFIITGPSGVGKGTICAQLLRRLPSLVPSISMTSRAKRPHEVDGMHYHFVERAYFERLIEENGFLEWAQYNGKYYGTPRGPVENALQSGHNVLLEIEVQGALQIKKIFPSACLIFVEPPSVEILRKRLIQRGTNEDDDIERRLAIGLEELHLKHEFDYLVLNDMLELCVTDVITIIHKETGGATIAEEIHS